MDYHQRGSGYAQEWRRDEQYSRPPYDGYPSRPDNRYPSRPDDRYPSRPDDRYPPRHDDHYGSMLVERYSNYRQDDRQSYRPDDRQVPQRYDDRNSTYDNRRGGGDRYQNNRGGGGGGGGGGFNRGGRPFQSRGGNFRGRGYDRGGGGGGGGNQYSQNNNSKYQRDESEEEEEEEEKVDDKYTWKEELGLEKDDVSKEIDFEQQAEEVKDELVSKILAKLSDPSINEIVPGPLNEENEILVLNIPSQVTAYQMQLLIGTCGQVNDFSQVDPEKLQSGVIAKYDNISSSFRAVRLLDRLQVISCCLNMKHVLPKSQLFKMELDWMTVHNDDAARRLIRLVLKDNDLLPPITGPSTGLFNPWTLVSVVEDEDARAFEYVQVVYLGDQRARWFRCPQQSGAPLQRFLERDRASLDQSIAAVDHSMTVEDNCLIMATLIHDFITFRKSSLLPDDAPEILTIRELFNLPTIIEQVQLATEKWSKEYPDLKVIWIMPHPVNFAQYNQILVSNSGYKDNLEETLGEQHEKDAKDFYSLIMELKTLWREKLPKVPFIHLSEIFFKKGNRGQSFKGDDKLIWPKGYTVDGLNPSERMTKAFWSNLIRWMKTIGLDHREIATKRNYIKPPKSYEGTISVTINGHSWYSGESSDVPSSSSGRLDRLDALWNIQDQEDEPSAKKSKTENDANDEQLSSSLETVKSNILNILNVHTQLQN